MTKQKKDKKGGFEQLFVAFLFIFLIMVICFAAVCITYKVFTGHWCIEKAEPSFKAYRVECRNETNQIGYSCGFSYKFNELNDTKTVNFTKIVENYKLKRGIEIAKEKCNEIVVQAQINSIGINYPETFVTWISRLYDTKQICEEVEVDGVWLDNSYYTSSGEFVNQSYFKFISDITLELLNEKCTCMATFEESIKCEITGEYPGLENCECPKYKCGDNIFVEALK